MANAELVQLAKSWLTYHIPSSPYGITGPSEGPFQRQNAREAEKVLATPQLTDCLGKQCKESIWKKSDE